MKSFLMCLMLACGLPLQAGAATLVPDSTIVWSHPDPRFGGLSGLEILDGGDRVAAIGDRGIWVTGNLKRKDGKLKAVRTTGIGHLHAVSGKIVTGSAVDAEGMTRDSQGRFYVSYEGLARIRGYADLDGPATQVPGNPAFKTIGFNKGLEAIAMDRNGVLHAIQEETRTQPPRFPVFRLRDGKWDKDLWIRRGEGFLVVDADFGPDGKFYVLERRFIWSAGFATRLRRFAPQPDGLKGEEILLQTKFGVMDNMEGLSVWKDKTGQTRVTLISDDNFFVLQRTELAEFILRED